MNHKLWQLLKLTFLTIILGLNTVSCYQSRDDTGISTSEEESQQQNNQPSSEEEISNQNPTRTRPNISTDIQEETRISVYEQANPSVVQIKTDGGAGSGFVIQADGLILTNAHVVNNTDFPVLIITADGTELEADLIAFHPQGADLAALKIRNQNNNNLPPLFLGKEEFVKVGQSVYAIGSPLGQRNSLTTGVVSRIESETNLIQHDASINPGNSGGPLLNSQAEVIGINTLIRTLSGGSDGLSFALTTDLMQPFLQALQGGDIPEVAERLRPKPPQRSPKNQSPNLSPQHKSLVRTFTEGDETLPNGSYFHAYPFRGKRGQTIEIEMVSEEIDPSLILISRDDENFLAQNDDISDQNFDARLKVRLPLDGDYILIARAYSVGETGEYTLTFKLR